MWWGNSGTTTLAILRTPSGGGCLFGLCGGEIQEQQLSLSLPWINLSQLARLCQ